MTPTTPVQPVGSSITWPAIAAAALPSLLAYNTSPSPTFLNQALAFALWGAFIAFAHPARLERTAALLWTALALLLASAVWAAGPGSLPSPLALSAIGTLIAAGLMAAAGSCSGRASPRESLYAAFAWAWLAAGALNVVIAFIQVFTPDLPDGQWIAASGIPGRAVGNLRQPNHLSSLLLWSCISVITLLDLRRLSLRWAWAAMAAFVFAVVLTASRTGLVSVLLLALWGLADRRLSRQARWLLVASPLVYAAAWWGMAQWAALAQHNFGGTARLAESDISGSRFGIWKNTWALIQAHPWTGVGFGNFNFAWTLTPFPGRPTAFFDHTHNLPLQLAVELGLPLAALVLGLLLWALGRAAWLAWRAEGDASTAQRCAVMMVLMIGLHSLLEYPLWYAYFLLPTAWAFGFALRGPAAHSAAPSTAPTSTDAPPTAHRVPALTLAAWALVAGALFSVWDYSRVAAIFVADAGSPPLEQRVARGQRSVFFAHHADYAAVTSKLPVADAARAFDRTTHYLLDTRLMTVWAQALAERGELDAARHLAARLREFGRAEAEGLFDVCADDQAVPAAPGLPFQCELPSKALRWQDFLPPR
jgi:O-antigen ligase